MKAKKEEVELVNEEKAVELCAISKEFAIKQVNKLVNEHTEVFSEYFYWANVINSQVNVVEKEDLDDKYAE